MTSHFSQIEQLELQIQEIEILENTFPDEFKLDSCVNVKEIKSFIKFKKHFQETPPEISFTITFNDSNKKWCLHCTLPHLYPLDKPKVAFMSSCLTRDQNSAVNLELQSQVAQLNEGDLSITLLIFFIQNLLENYQIKKDDSKEQQSSCCDKKARIWFYSHHIYSSEKMRKISHLAKIFNLNGFCLKGKPGVICIEGFEKESSKFTQEIKKWNWQKLVVRHEEYEEEAGKDEDLFSCFTTFEFLSFQNRGDFKIFLTEHKCQQMFTILFGI